MSTRAEAERGRPRRIGIFGGTFDPVHLGHLVAAVNARYLLGLDVVELVVANDPWQKTEDRPVSPAASRLALVAAAVESHPGLHASGIEIERGGPSYTIDTVETLRAREPGAQLYLVVGADVVPGLSTWERYEDLQRLVRLAVMTRPGAPRLVDAAALSGWQVDHLVVPLLEISSTDLRERARDGRPLDFLVPDAAIRLIAEQNLYA